MITCSTNKYECHKVERFALTKKTLFLDGTHSTI